MPRIDKRATVKETISDSVITEFRNGFPQKIPVRPGVDLGKLTEGDELPFFLTLEISSEGKVSDNGLIHDKEFGETVVKQIMSGAAEGIMGHIKEQERETAFPVSDIHWIGAIREGSKTWAKGYIPKTAVAQREHFRILMATNGKAATSVYGQAIKEIVDGKRGTWRAKGFELEQLDLAPYTRASLKPESGFVVTSEMTEENKDNPSEDNMDKLTIIKEMTPDDAPLLPKPVREAILATVQEPAEVKLVTELRAALGVDDKADIAAVITEMKQFKETQQKTAVSGRIKELVEDKDNGIKAESLRPLVIELVAGRNPQTVEEAESAYKTVAEMQMIKDALKANLQSAMGPNQRAPMQPQNGQSKYFDIPKEEK